LLIKNQFFKIAVSIAITSITRDFKGKKNRQRIFRKKGAFTAIASPKKNNFGFGFKQKKKTETLKIE